MNMDEYQRLAMRTCDTSRRKRVQEALLGLIGETGEIVDVAKKHLFQSETDAQLPREQLAEEIGDVLWYMAELADGMQSQMADFSLMEFAYLDNKVRKHNRARPGIEHMAEGTCRRALQIYSAVCSSQYKSVGMDYRRLLLMLAQLAYAAGYRMEEIAQMNIEKLEKRYPQGFDARKSAERYQ